MNIDFGSPVAGDKVAFSDLETWPAPSRPGWAPIPMADLDSMVRRVADQEIGLPLLASAYQVGHRARTGLARHKTGHAKVRPGTPAHYWAVHVYDDGTPEAVAVGIRQSYDQQHRLAIATGTWSIPLGCAAFARDAVQYGRRNTVLTVDDLEPVALGVLRQARTRKRLMAERLRVWKREPMSVLDLAGHVGLAVLAGALTPDQGRRALRAVGDARADPDCPPTRLTLWAILSRAARHGRAGLALEALVSATEYCVGLA